MQQATQSMDDTFRTTVNVQFRLEPLDVMTLLAVAVVENRAFEGTNKRDAEKSIKDELRANGLDTQWTWVERYPDEVSAAGRVAVDLFRKHFVSHFDEKSAAEAVAEMRSVVERHGSVQAW